LPEEVGALYAASTGFHFEALASLLLILALEFSIFLTNTTNAIFVECVSRVTATIKE
jgi:hypothetical protein